MNRAHRYLLWGSVWIIALLAVVLQYTSRSLDAKCKYLYRRVWSWPISPQTNSARQSFATLSFPDGSVCNGCFISDDGVVATVLHAFAATKATTCTVEGFDYIHGKTVTIEYLLGEVLPESDIAFAKPQQGHKISVRPVPLATTPVDMGMDVIVCYAKAIELPDEKEIWQAAKGWHWFQIRFPVSTMLNERFCTTLHPSQAGMSGSPVVNPEGQLVGLVVGNIPFGIDFPEERATCISLSLAWPRRQMP